MKTFSTTGTGGGQTLTEIETDKIPIYENRAAVEADLANLTEGQIVATKDTGDELAQPVDVVEEDNLHAVTSNAVASITKILSAKTGSSANIKWVDLPSGFTESNTFVLGQKLYYSVQTYITHSDIQLFMSNNGNNQIGIEVNNSAFYNLDIDILIMKKGA